MNLVAIYDRISVLVRRHEGYESLGLTTALDEEVLEVKQLHLPPLCRGFPARFRLLVILGTGEFDQLKARLEISVRETGSCG